MVPHRLNSTISDHSFSRSCETVRNQTKRFDSRTLNSILTFDNSQEPFIEHGQDLYLWYFAIGSMINPVSVHLRDLTPLVSYPARCDNHQLVFRDHCGMADIEECPGMEFHGVVHLLPIEQMLRLDKVEHMYERVTVNITDYQGRSRLAFVYKMTLVDDEERTKTLPTERYIDIIAKGCEYFGICSSYINRLKYDQPVIPRKSSVDYRTIDDLPAETYFTIDDLQRHNGNDPNLPIWIAVNGKILEYDCLPSIDDSDYENHKRFYDFILSCFAGREVAHVISRTWYEPMYPVPLTENDLCDGHRALAEDMCVSWGLNNGGGNQDESFWRPIGRLV